jgi:hypothetical protein
MADVSQSCSILLQQFRSSADICRPGTMHAITGAAMMDMIRRSTASCDALCNMTILLGGQIRKRFGHLHYRSLRLPLRCCIRHVFTDMANACACSAINWAHLRQC